MVEPHECLGSVWSQRAKPGNEHLASTVRATITQFNGVVSFVMTTCLGDPSMKTQDIAKVVEYWIQVAKVSPGRHSGVPVWGPAKGRSSCDSSQESSLRSKSLHSV